MLTPNYSETFTSLSQLDVNDWKNKLGKGTYGEAYKVTSKVGGYPLCAKRIQLDSTTPFDFYNFFHFFNESHF